MARGPKGRSPPATKISAMVPHLITALTGPINELEQRILESMPVIERWFRLEWMEHTPPFYTAVDVRNAGFKLSPVATHLFPSGWHHLTPQMLPLAVQAAMAAIEKICPEARNLLIVPDNQLSEADLASLAQLSQVFRMAGLNVRLGSISPELNAPKTVQVPGVGPVTLEPAVRSRHRLGLTDFDPCTILLNNDLASGVPGILEELHEQYLLPPLHAGWDTRRMSRHFEVYEELAKRFGKQLGVDHWLLTPVVPTTGAIDLASPVGLEALRAQVDGVLARIRRKFKDYAVNEKPFVVVRSDNGRRQWEPFSVRDPKEIDAAVAQRLPALAASAHGTRVELLVNEGLLTQERVSEHPAEPTVYMMDRYVVGGFYRVQTMRQRDDGLMPASAAYEPLAFAGGAPLPQPGAAPGASEPNRFYMYGVVARLAMLAAAYELEATDPLAESDA
jgi:glutamate--cysteine ligase